MAEDVTKKALRFGDQIDLNDMKSLEAWLNNWPREFAVVLAARAALRVPPLDIAVPETAEGARKIRELISSLFRSSALARVVAKYPIRAQELAAAALNAAKASSEAADYAVETQLSANRAVANAAHALAYAAAYDPAANAAAATAFFVNIAAAAISSETVAAARIALSNDTRFLSDGGATGELADSPLWSGRTPPAVAELWTTLKAALPPGEDWEVWTRWYDERLAGAPSRGEAYELVFAKVPVEVWDKGPLRPIAGSRSIYRRLRQR